MSDSVHCFYGKWRGAFQDAAAVIAGLCLFAFASCVILKNTDRYQAQRARTLAEKYSSAAWPERREIIREIVKYYKSSQAGLVTATLTRAAEDSHQAVRVEAVRAIDRVEEKWSHELLRKCALSDASDNVRWYALKALKKRRDPADIEVFIRGMQSEDWLVREESVGGMLALDDATIRERLVPYIIRAINDPRTNVSLAALRKIRVKDDRLYAAITAKLYAASDFDYSLITSCLEALYGYRLDEKTRERIIQLLLHQNVRIRLLALHVLKRDAALSPRIR